MGQVVLATKAEMMLVSSATTSGWSLTKSTPNSAPLTHFTIAFSMCNGSSQFPGKKICKLSAIPTETGTFPVIELPLKAKSLMMPSPFDAVSPVADRHQFLESLILAQDKPSHVIASVSVTSGNVGIAASFESRDRSV